MAKPKRGKRSHTTFIQVWYRVRHSLISSVSKAQTLAPSVWGRVEPHRARSRLGTGRISSSFSKKEWEKMREKHFIMWERQDVFWKHRWGSINMAALIFYTERTEGQSSDGGGWPKTWLEAVLLCSNRSFLCTVVSPLSEGEMFQDPQWKPETTGGTKP